MPCPPGIPLEFHERLLANDTPKAFAVFSQEQLNLWVEHNVLHAIQKCPRVLKYWRQGVNKGDFRVLQSENRATSQVELAGFIAAAWEHLTEEDKIEKLRGARAHTSFNDTVLHDFERALSPALWPRLSPSWLGAPGSPLREQATRCWWKPSCLESQVEVGLRMAPETQPAWVQWCPMPYSLLVYHKNTQYHAETSAADTQSASSHLVAAHWADTVDAALARHLVDVLPNPVGKACTFEVHANVAPLTEHQNMYLKTLIEVNASLGTLDSTVWPRIQNGSLRNEVLGAKNEVLEFPHAFEH